MPIRRLRFGLVLSFAAIALGAASKSPFTRRHKAYYADAATVDFVRPGLALAINSAQVAADGAITVVFTVADPKGLPLDTAGINTPGAISLSFVASYIPSGQEQYVAYTTRPATGAVGGTVNQAGSDTGGTTTKIAEGQYQYVFHTKAPSGFDASATHTIGIYGSRNLAEFNLGVNYAGTTFNFVPNGSPVANVRDVIKTQSCDKCHDQLSAHGGSRRGIEMCVLCHTPQTVDPNTGNTIDLKVMAHKIHMGSQLPSVQAGKPYRIVGFMNSVNDWSTVVYPSDPRRCESCHDQNTGAKQATAYLTNPTRAACGSCHDDVNFASGANHAGGPQISDNQCSTCHVGQGELDFDASIKGAHVVPTESRMLSGIVANLAGVTNGAAGQSPTVAFSVKDNNGQPVPLSRLGAVSLTMAGPTSDFGYTNFGSDVTTNGYVTESATGASCGGDGACSYTFQHAVPAGATGTYSVGIEARRTETLLPNTTKQMIVTYGAINKVVDFSVDGSAVQPRRTVVDIDNCNQCHTMLSVHGTLRNQTQYCVLCHNPSNTDASQRVNATNPADKALPPQGIDFDFMIHRIHTGENLKADNKSFTIVGFGGSHNDFTDVRYPAMSPQGSPGDTRNCSMCHVKGSEQNLPTGLNAVMDPQGPINPVQPVTAACTACHVTIPAASHALANTTTLGESCEVCHGQSGDFNVGKVHAQY
ncbi:MAG: OmcA/MtrC family decaheme c-type cytochrome [Bryobacteraceae bacterium]